MENNFCYIHIPFCTSKCKYCRFASFGVLNELKINLYIKYLLKEIQDKNTDFNLLKSVYFGGGTPSILNLKQFNDIFKVLNSKYTYDKNIEINIEATPLTITKENLIGWKKLGINRISIGVQTLNNDSLIEIGRGNKGDIINALNIIDKVGFKNVNIDFIIGLPFVKSGEIKNDIDFILNKYDFIKHISVYMLEEYYDVPDEINSKFENITYPNNWNSIGLTEENYLDEYIEIKKYLISKGFNSYEISNFSKKGFECKHNKSYWNHSNILAFGLGAHGFLNNIRYSNSEVFSDYYLNKDISIDIINDEDIFIEEIMFGLRTIGLDDNLYKYLDNNKINTFIEDGYLYFDRNKLKITDKGILVLDFILKEII